MKKNKLLLLCLLVFCSVFLVSCAPAEVVEKYKEAKTLYDSGKYSEASDLFLELSQLEEPFRDSEKKYGDCQYHLALQNMDDHRYEEALERLTSILGINNSEFVTSEIDRCYYYIAEDYMKMKEYDTAREYYLNAGDYYDSTEKADECLEQKEKQQNNFREWTEKVNKKLEEYGIPVLDDLVVNSVAYKREDYKDKNGSHVVLDKVFYSSPSFETLSLSDQLTVIEVIKDVTPEVILINEFSLDSNGSEYSGGSSNKYNFLKKDGEIVYQRVFTDSPTYKVSSTKKSNSSGSSSTSGGSGWGMCSKCHSKTATHGAYCDDCYYEEVSDLADKGISLHEMEMWANGYPEYDDAYGY